MKRITIFSLMIILGFGLVAIAYANPNRASGPGQHPGYGMGPGGGHGAGHGQGMEHRPSHCLEMGMKGHDFNKMPFWDNLSQKQQEQLEKLQISTMPSTMEKTFSLRRKTKDLDKLIEKFPLDRKTVEAKLREVSKEKLRLINLRLDMMVKVQKIIGQKNWELMHSEKSKGSQKDWPFHQG